MPGLRITLPHTCPPLSPLQNMATPLIGGDNPELHPSDFSGITPCSECKVCDVIAVSVSWPCLQCRCGVGVAPQTMAASPSTAQHSCCCEGCDEPQAVRPSSSLFDLCAVHKCIIKTCTQLRAPNLKGVFFSKCDNCCTGGRKAA